MQDKQREDKKLWTSKSVNGLSPSTEAVLIKPVAFVMPWLKTRGVIKGRQIAQYAKNIWYYRSSEKGLLLCTSRHTDNFQRHFKVVMCTADITVFVDICCSESGTASSEVTATASKCRVKNTA